MANNIFTGAINSNSNVAGNWSLGVVPTNGDGNTAVLDASSPNIKIVGSSLQVDGGIVRFLQAILILMI